MKIHLIIQIVLSVLNLAGWIYMLYLIGQQRRLIDKINRNNEEIERIRKKRNEL